MGDTYISDEVLPESKFIACGLIFESNLCRICLLTGNHFNLLDESTNQTISYLQKLMACIPSLNITDADPFTRSICIQCCQLLDQAYDFHLLCIQSDTKLRHPMTDVRIKIEVEDTFDRVVMDEKETVANLCNKTVKTEPSVNPRKVRKNAAVRDENGKYIRRVSGKYECKICGKRMFNNVALIQHLRIHTGERPFVCEVCGKSFRTRGAIKRHSESHNINGPKKYNCTQCSFRAHCSIAFSRHAIVHTNGRPFQCDICKGKFKSKVIVGHHINRVHLLKFRCQICGDKFSSARGLQAHVKIHYLPKQCRCSECNKLYSHFKSLTNHMKRIHPHLQRPKRTDLFDKI